MQTIAKVEEEKAQSSLAESRAQFTGQLTAAEVVAAGRVQAAQDEAATKLNVVQSNTEPKSRCDGMKKRVKTKKNDQCPRCRFLRRSVQ